MDLSSMLNDGPVPDKRPSQASPTSDASRRGSAATLPGQGYAYGAPATGVRGLSGAHRPEHIGPVHGPPPGFGQAQRGLMPLQTPGLHSQNSAGDYPFSHQQPSQSPGAGFPLAQHPHQHSSHDAYAASTPTSRPSSHGFAHAQNGLQALPYNTHAHAHHGNASASPTPSSSRHSQTPHSVRQSPLAAPNYPPSQAAAHQYHSHPTTPLGPPPLVTRTSHASDFSSPHHTRTPSSASNGLTSGSPAQHRPSIGNLLDSPQVLNKPSPQPRQEHQSIDREHSVSVSPKTKVTPRPSVGSRHSSQQNIQNSMVLPAGGPGHVRAPQPTHLSHLEGAVVQMPPQLPNLSAVAPSVSSSHAAAAMPLFPHSTQTSSAFPATTSTDVVSAAPPAVQPRPNSQRLKRPAESDSDDMPPTKRARGDRPKWALLDQRNPRFVSLAASLGSVQPPTHSASSMSAIDSGPLDHDLILARRLLDPNFEKSIERNTPVPEMVRIVCDWLYTKVGGVGELDGAAIEIEAKFGTLIDVNTNERVRNSVPIMVATPLPESSNKSIRFESQMGPDEHKQMNTYLNQKTEESLQSGRTPIKYKHIRETDTFNTLTDLGIQILPQTVRQRKQRDLKLRTTYASPGPDQPPQVKARIVKLNLGDLNIYNPMSQYDCRISVNLEVNLLRPGLDVAALIKDPAEETNVQPARKKDRLSYTHSGYSIDLTRVDVEGTQPKYELELELDAGKLSREMQRMTQGEPNACMIFVEGFLTNAHMLTRQCPRVVGS